MILQKLKIIMLLPGKLHSRGIQKQYCKANAETGLYNLYKQYKYLPVQLFIPENKVYHS